MIEVTNEMVHTFADAYGKADDGSTKTILGGLAEKSGIAAVLAIVERDYRTEPRPPWDRAPQPCSYPGCGKPTAYLSHADGQGEGWRHVDPADEVESHVGYPMSRDVPTPATAPTATSGGDV